MKRKILFILIIALIFIISQSVWGDYLTLEYLKQNKDILNDYYQAHQVQSILIYFSLYVIVTAISIPGATILTLGGSSIMGFWVSLCTISFASTIGASLAFLLSRYLFKDFIQRRYKDKLKLVNDEMDKDGAFYLLSLRLLPVMPFFVINLLMGVTKISLAKYYIVSQLGMLAGTIVYVNAGTELGKIHNVSDILSFNLLASFFALALFPILVKNILKYKKIGN